MNKYTWTIAVAPMNANSNNYPARIEVKHDIRIVRIVIVQIRTIDKQMIIKILG